MQSIAAYYVIVANDMARSRTPRYRVAVPRTNLSARIARALSAVARPLRASGGSPA